MKTLFRCTFPGRYDPGTPGHTPHGKPSTPSQRNSRQGYYARHETALDAAKDIAGRDVGIDRAGEILETCSPEGKLSTFIVTPGKARRPCTEHTPRSPDGSCMWCGARSGEAHRTPEVRP